MSRDQVRDLSRLRRARDGRLVAGVCEGLSRHLDIDPLLVRVVFGALTVFGGAGLILYLLAWLTIPADQAQDSVASRTLHQDADRTMAVGLVLAGIAAVVTLLGAIGFSTPRPWAVITVSVLALILFTVFSRRGGSQAFRPASPEPYRHPQQDLTTPGGIAMADESESAPGVLISSAAASPAAPEQDAGAERTWWQRPYPADTQVGPRGPRPPYPPSFSSPGPPPLRPPKPRSRLTPISLAVMALTLGGIWFADAAGLDVQPSVYPGSVLALTAVALVLGTWYGRAKLLIPVGLVSAVLTAALTVIGPGPYGERVYEPTTAAAVEDSYHHGAGRVVVNLDQVRDINKLDGRTIKVDSQVGLVQVVIPTSIDAALTSRVDGGQISGPAVVNDTGNGAQQSVTPAIGDGRPAITIDVALRFGRIEIYRFDCPHLPAAAQGSRGKPVSTLIWKGNARDPAACH